MTARFGVKVGDVVAILYPTASSGITAEAVHVDVGRLRLNHTF